VKTMMDKSIITRRDAKGKVISSEEIWSISGTDKMHDTILKRNKKGGYF